MKRKMRFADRSGRNGRAARGESALREGLSDCPTHIDVKTRSPLQG